MPQASTTLLVLDSEGQIVERLHEGPVPERLSERQLAALLAALDFSEALAA